MLWRNDGHQIVILAILYVAGLSRTTDHDEALASNHGFIAQS